MTVAENGGPDGPVLISVPHAGRDAPPGLDALLRLPRERLLPLEDRLVDALAGRAGAAGIAVIAAAAPRLWIDLNRSERELDPAMVAGGWPDAETVTSAKVRGGLGLIPRRLAGIGELWRQPLAREDVRARIERVHRPFHARIEAALHARRVAFGRAVLIDLHSMPPGAGAEIVIGDLFGRSADAQTVFRAITIARDAGFSVALNRPYAGGHVIERHGRPAAGVDAIQLEISRPLYLKPDLATLDPAGVDRLGRLVHAIAVALGARDRWPLPVAAE